MSPYNPSQFLRDLDDSSDEETIDNRHTRTIDYSEDATAQPVINTSVGSRLFYIVHVLANQLLYSKEVNQVYYPEKEKQLKQVKTENFTINELWRKLLEEVLQEVLQRACQYLHFPDGQPLTKEFINVLHITVAAKAQKLITQIINTIKAPPAEITNRKMYLGKIQQLICTRFNEVLPEMLLQEKQGNLLVYRAPRNFMEITKTEKAEATVKFNSYTRKTIVDIAIESIKERLSINNKMPTPNSRKRTAALISPLTRLASAAWDLVKIEPGRISAKKVLNNDHSKLKYAYFEDLIRLDQAEQLDTLAWQEAQHKNDDQNIDNTPLIAYLQLSDARFEILICNEINDIFQKKIKYAFGCISVHLR